MALTRTFFGINQDVSGTPVTQLQKTIDSTGYEFIIVAVSWEGAPDTCTVADNKGNTYTPLPRIDNTFNNDISAQMFYGSGGTPGASHTITATFDGVYCEIAVWGMHASAGTVAIDQHIEAQGNVFAATDLGDLVNTAAACSFLHAHGYASQTGSPGTGWTEDSEANNNYCESRGPDATATIACEWTFTGNQYFAGVAASFKESAGGGGSTIYNRKVLGSPIFNSRVLN